MISTTRSFRPSGFGRYVIAAFLLVWLAGWAAGEGFALFAIAGILSRTAGTITQMPDWLSHPASTGAVVFIVLFLGLWLTFWTIGGIAAWTFQVRSLWGEDTIAHAGGIRSRAPRRPGSAAATSSIALRSAVSACVRPPARWSSTRFAVRAWRRRCRSS